MLLYYYLIAICIGFVGLFFLVFYLFKNYHRQIIEYVIKSIQPRFVTINITPDSKLIIQLAIDYWRLKERIDILKQVEEIDNKKINMSLSRIEKYIKSYNIEIKDFKGEKYSDDILAIEVKSTEPTSDKSKDMFIKDVIQPAIFVNGQLVEKAKVIVYKYENTSNVDNVENNESDIEVIETK